MVTDSTQKPEEQRSLLLGDVICIWTFRVEIRDMVDVILKLYPSKISRWVQIPPVNVCNKTRTNSFRSGCLTQFCQMTDDWDIIAELNRQNAADVEQRLTEAWEKKRIVIELVYRLPFWYNVRGILHQIQKRYCFGQNSSFKLEDQFQNFRFPSNCWLSFFFWSVVFCDARSVWGWQLTACISIAFWLWREMAMQSQV